ncbi:MAG: 2-succinyl-5-enolpyruvyl-6-hydroxy-3-cyclohexene-1-carboxylic-acid synthase [Prevotella sp.]|nr:2-succinyl-5-enolpyruvyl-6-hydroxy-3-cyclohexene-1-carboxylic-acid synthase [Prevotella sp.]MBF1585363.1 2-succinyl-5-enolpyruvyl-6-hydroxy-3-cyclohexene-1-carboxylic-acid synthase [Prevotella sp.]
MYSNQEHINCLTSLLVAHQVKYAVLCPGSRNAPIVHNLNACPILHCYSVTDERSAGFYALGLSLMIHEPVAICVTSGTALLNVLPAIAEAWHQHVPLILISADRPAAWIGQQDGQTLQQQGSLSHFVRCVVDISTPHTAEDSWFCNRRLNEALIKAQQGSGAPVHINLHIDEPLYDFSVSELPEERSISLCTPTLQSAICQSLQAELHRALRPVVVMGQLAFSADWDAVVAHLQSQGIVVLCEPLSSSAIEAPIDALMALAETADIAFPDFILYVGGTLVSKQLKAFLRRALNASCWVVNEEGDIYDTFQNLRGVVQATPCAILQALVWGRDVTWRQSWQALNVRAKNHVNSFSPHYSSMQVIRYFEQLLSELPGVPVVHYGNSMAVRIGCLYARHFIYCNRGVNGIEGSLSTAAGQSLGTEENVFCIIGDLSFFYDQNALWNQNLRGNLRILLLNNGGGAIFSKFEGLRQSEAREKFVMGVHQTSAKGICMACHVDYYAATSSADSLAMLPILLTQKRERPVLLEVFTKAEDDMRAYESFFQTLVSADVKEIFNMK